MDQLPHRTPPSPSTQTSKITRARPGPPPSGTLLLTVPNVLGVDHDARLLEAVVRHVAPAVGWVHPDRR